MMQRSPISRLNVTIHAGWKWVICVVGLVGILPVSAVWGQYSPERGAKLIHATDELKVESFATEPMIINPISIDIDAEGRVWVTEGVNYRKNVKVPPDNALKVLEDTNRDGKADKMTVFTADLNAAMSVCVAGTRIFVAESPHIYVYEDANQDLKPDGPRQIFLTGFGGKNHDHGVHGLLLGPDHKLYMTCGDSGYNVTGPDGRHVEFRWGGLLRCELDGTQLEEIAVNFRNPWELAVDSLGHVWCSDNDNDGLRSVRICWILEGGNYGWFGGPERIFERDGNFLPIHHWRADQPGFVPYARITGFGSPAGMTFNEGNGLGENLKGKLIHCDPGPREIRAYAPLVTHGYGYSTSVRNIVTTEDDYFRPIDPCIAPDGSLYVTDWYDGGVGGHNYNDPTRGRIYRISRADAPAAVAVGTLKNRDVPAAVAALSSPNHATAYMARSILLENGEEALAALQPMIQSAKSTPQMIARCMWVLDRMEGLGRAEVVGQLQHRDPDLRALAIRILRRHGADFASEIVKLANDPHPEVQTELLLSLRNATHDDALRILQQACEKFDGDDRYWLETLKCAARGREQELAKALRLTTPAEWNDKTVRLMQILLPDQAVTMFANALRQAKLSVSSKLAVLRGLVTSPKPEAGAAVITALAQSEHTDVRRLALEGLRQRLNLFWKQHALDPQLEVGLVKALNDVATRGETCKVVGQFPRGLKQVEQSLLKLAGDESLSNDERIETLKSCAALGLQPAYSIGLNWLSHSDARVRSAGIDCCAALGDLRQIQNILGNSEISGDAKTQLLKKLAERNEGGVILFRLVETGRLPKELKGLGIQLGTDHADTHVRMLFAKYLPAEKRPRTLGEEYSPEQILMLTGNGTRGARIFNQGGAASCNKCHRIQERGNDIGPNLTQIGRKYERRALLETIINPSAAVAPEYIAYVVETRSGKVYAGFLQSDTPAQVVLKTIEGEPITIPRGDIEELVQQKISLMPDAVLKEMTAQDAADLLEYLSKLK